MALPFWLKCMWSRKWAIWKVFPFPLDLVCIAMAGAPVEFDRIVPEETQGPMPVEAPLAAESLDSFQRVEAVMKDEDVSTLGLDSQDWEMVAEMVEDTENAATNFMQSAHMVVLTGPAPNTRSRQWWTPWRSWSCMGTTGSGVAPSKPEDVTSAAAASPLDSPLSMRVRWNWPSTSRRCLGGALVPNLCPGRGSICHGGSHQGSPHGQVWVQSKCRDCIIRIDQLAVERASLRRFQRSGTFSGWPSLPQADLFGWCNPCI